MPTAQFGDKGQYTYNVDAKGVPYGAPIKPTIDAQNIGTTSPLKLAPSVLNTGAAGLEQSIASTTAATKAAADAKARADLDLQKISLNKDKNEIGILSDKLGTAGQVREKEFQSLGGDKAKMEVDRLTSEIEAEQLATRRRIEALEKNNPTGMLESGLRGEISRIQRESTQYQADKAIILNAALRRFDTASEIADRKKELFLEPLKARLDTLKFFYQENKADFNKADDRLFNEAVKKADREYEDAKEIQDANTEMIKSAVTAGASPALIQKAMDLSNSGADPVQVAQALGVYADYKGTLEIRKLKAEIAKAQAVDPGINPSQVLDVVPGGMGGSILAQTGLSLLAFNYITQGTPALSRLSESARNKIFTEAQTFLNKNGLDVSTFQSRFKAYNETLNKNIQRFNNTVIAEDEILGTIDNLSTAADEGDFNKLKAGNVAKLFAGEQTNDPTTLKYQVHLNQLRSELAFYNAAVQGKTSADLIEFSEAERIIKNGISSGSLAGFQEAIEASVIKMHDTLQRSVDRSSQQVWGLFGIADKFQSQNAPTTQADNPFSAVIKNDGQIINPNGEWILPTSQPTTSTRPTLNFSRSMPGLSF